MKTTPFLILSLWLTTAVCQAQDNQPAPYDSGWYLATNALTPLTQFSTPIASIANPTYPGGSNVIAEAITSDISALASNLENDPTRIFNYVHDQIRYVHYFGSHKGAEMTLLERSGNDFDQCALLVALLRSAGFSPTYQFGLISIPYSASNQQDYQHWIGATQPNTNWTTASALAGYINARFGYPLTATFSGDTNDVLFHHVWVKVTVNGTNFSLDPAYKVNLPTNGVNLDSAMQLNTNTLISGVTSGSTSTTNYVQGLNEANLRSTLGTYNANLLSYLQGNYPDATVQQIIGGQSTVPSTGQPLGQATPITAQTLNGQSPVSTWTNIPTSLMAVLIVNLPGTNNSFYLPGLAGSRLSVVCASNGVAQLYQEDSLVTSVQTTGTNTTFTPTIGIQHPFGTNWSFSTPGFAPARYAGFDQSVSNQPYLRTNATYVLLYGLDANAAWLTKRQQQLNAYLGQGYGDSSQQVTSETLNVMGLGWLTQTELAQELIAGQTSTLDHFVHRLGRMALETGQGYYIDVYEQVVPIASDNSTNSTGVFAQDQAFQISLYFGSAMEHGIIEQLQSSNEVAASTVHLLELASTNAEKIYLATSNNWTAGADVAGSISNYTINSLYTNYINQGYYLLLPQNGSIQIAGSNSWAGSGYVAFQSQANGAQATKMIIGGNYNGGYSAYSTDIPNTPVVVAQNNSQLNLFNPQSATLPVATPLGADPVNLVDGSFQISSTDLSLGQTEPCGLNLTRYYSSARRTSNPAGMAAGWLHNYYCTALPTSAALAGLGSTTPQQMAPMMVAVSTALNIYNSSQPSAQSWVTTALVAKWGIDQLINNAVTINLGNVSLQFVKQPDGSYTPQANCTMSLLPQTNGTYWLQERHGRTFEFSTNNVLVNLVDPYGQSMTLAYNSNNLVTDVTDSKGRSLSFTYSGGVLTSVGDNTSRSVSYGYTSNANGQLDLTLYTDPESKTNGYNYDTNHQVIATLNALGQVVVSNIYNGFGQVTTQYSQGNTNKAWQIDVSDYYTVQTDPDGDQQVYTYDNKSRLIAFQDAVGNVTQTFYDGQDHVVQTISPLNETNLFFYDSSNNLIETIDPLGYSNIFHYDSQNNLIAIFDPRGNSNTFTYNSTFSVLTSTNGAGNGFSLTYNTNGTIATRADPGGTTTYNYDSYGQLISVAYPGSLGTDLFLNSAAGDVLTHTNARSMVTTFQYNQRRQLTNTVAPTNLTVSLAYDAVGNLQTSTDARGNSATSTWSATRHLTGTTFPSTPQGSPVVTNIYDTRDWLAETLNPLTQPTYISNNAAEQAIAVADALSRTNTFKYDPDSHLTNATDAASEMTVTMFDARGEAIKLIDAAGGTVGKTYDAAGNMTYLTNRNTNTWQFQYDSANRLTNAISPTTKKTGRVFNNRGLLASVTDPLNQSTTFSYDARGRMTNHTDAAATNGFQYDPDNNVTAATDVGRGTGLSWGYDAYDRPIGCTNAAGYIIKYGYDANGNLTTLTYPGNLPVTYTYDNLNRVTTVTDWASRVTTNTYDLAGELTSTTRPNGTTRTAGYDADGEMTNIVERYTAGVMAIDYLALTWSNSGRMQWEFLAPLPHAFTPPSRTMTYDADNRLYTFNGNSVTMDNDGNMTYGPGTNNSFLTYSYNARNQLTGAGGITYGYDPAGNRTLMTNGSVVTTNVIDPLTSQLLMRIRAGATNYYVYGAGLLYEIDVTATTTNTVYYHFDSRGSTIALTDGSGNITDRMEYAVYGMTTYRLGTTDTPFLYNGRYGVQTDPNGLLYMRARYYNPYICRFINADPSGFAGGLNFYQFANGNPLSMIDPSGLGAVGDNSGTTLLIGGAPANTADPFQVLQNAGTGQIPCIVCHGVSAQGFNGNVNSFSGLTALPGSGPNAMQGYATETALANAMAPFLAGPVGGMIGDALDAGTTAATAAQSVLGTQVTIVTATDPLLAAVTADGQVITNPNLLLSHQVFAQRTLGITGTQLPAGTWVGTVGNINGQIIGLNSATFYGNQLPASQAIQTILQGALSAR